ncbi:glycosyltransferase [Christiangramia sp. ASW11-125]|uniref:glycosyltransferase n=1 Tax=Christiangramia sp. ASW11-125 TaxID=3400701 RepID=UPI003AACED48
MVLLDILTNIDRKKYSFTVFLPKNSSFSSLLEDNGIAYEETLEPASNGYLSKLLAYYHTTKRINSGKFDLIFINQAGVLRPISILNNLISKKPILCEVSTLEDAYWVNSLSTRITNRVKSFISNSAFIEDKLTIENSKKSTLYYGYQPKDLKKVEKKQSKNPFNIILLGRISKSKGHFLLIEAAKNLKDYPFKFYIVGNAPSAEIEKDFINRIEKADLQSMFVLRGFQTNIQKELENMHMMVIPSIQEPFGRIFCEAAEAGIPSLVSNSGGLGELSKHFGLGQRFTAEDANDLSDKLIMMYNTYESITGEYKDRAEIMLQRLKMESYIDKMEQLLKSTAHGKEVSINWFGDNN